MNNPLILLSIIAVVCVIFPVIVMFIGRFLERYQVKRNPNYKRSLLSDWSDYLWLKWLISQSWKNLFANICFCFALFLVAYLRPIHSQVALILCVVSFPILLFPFARNAAKEQFNKFPNSIPSFVGLALGILFVWAALERFSETFLLENYSNRLSAWDWFILTFYPSTASTLAASFFFRISQLLDKQKKSIL